MIQNWDLRDSQGKRKYLTAEERQRFSEAISDALPREKRTFALILYYSGCRISEALELTVGRVDYGQQGAVFKALKRKDHHRFVPLPSSFLDKLDDVHHIKDFNGKDTDKRIWSFNRKTGWSAIKAVMDKAQNRRRPVYGSWLAP